MSDTNDSEMKPANDNEPLEPEADATEPEDEADEDEPEADEPEDATPSVESK
jgi:hypothetical protein